MYYTCFFKPTQPFSTKSVKYFAFFNPFYVQNFIRIHLHFSFYSQHRLTINIKILRFPGLRPKITAADLKKYRGEVHCANHSDEPLKAKIVSAEASTIFESHLHCTISAFTPILFLNPPSRLWAQTWRLLNIKIQETIER